MGGGESEESKQMEPRSNSTNLQNGLEWLVYSSLQIMLFSSSSASSSHTFSFHGHIQIIGIFLSQVGPFSSTREARRAAGHTQLQGKVGEPSPRLASRPRAGGGNLPPSRSSVTEFKEILPKYKDPDSGRSLGASRSQYPPARSA